MNFGEVLTRSWNIIWKYKVLWIFGFLASLAGSGGGNGGSASNMRYNGSSNGNFPFPGVERFFNNISPLVVLLLILLVFFLFLVFIVLGTLGRAGLIRGAWLADSGETNLTFGRLFRDSQSYFWRVLLLGLLTFAVSLSLVLLITIPTVLAAALTAGIALICLLPLICLLIPLFIVLGVIVDLAIIAIVGENVGVMEGLRRAWTVFSTHLGEIIGIGLIILVASAVVGFVIGLPALLIVAPMATAFFTGSQNFIRAGSAVTIILFIIYLPILLALRSIITAYIETTWTVTFRRLTGRGAGTAEIITQSAL